MSEARRRCPSCDAISGGEGQPDDHQDEGDQSGDIGSTRADIEAKDLFVSVDNDHLSGVHCGPIGGEKRGSCDGGDRETE
jgi:hypothetical protein